jgi:enoyl-CoA hydratase/carnithine racemase
MAGTKLVLEALADGTAGERSAEIAAAAARAMNSEDYREATRAFAEKRRPVFKGR